MITDLSGGLDPDLEYFLPERPAHPQMRDSATLWLMDEDGSLAFPRVTIDAIGSHWDRPWLQMNLVLSDGRALRLWDQFPSHSAVGTERQFLRVGRGSAPVRVP